jgi:hypothetical protein
VTGQGVGRSFGWTYKLLGLRYEGESAFTEHIPNERTAYQSKGGIVSTWTFSFEPHESGTKLNLVVEYTIPVPVLGKFAEGMVLNQNEREANLAMANIKARMEE